MRVLIVGSGGREHALAWKLAQTEEVFAVPGNPGIAQLGPCFPDADPLDLCRSLGIDLVVVGPEVPLIDGLADRLRSAGFPVFGPGADAARLEGSKAFSKELMAEAGVPTARFGTFTDPKQAKEFAATLPRVVVKASGNAQGKGVVVCEDLSEANLAIDSMLVNQAFGAAGSEIVVEERLQGPEFSLLTLVSGTDFKSLPVAQDHKRAQDGDLGPNTGGMGTVSPASWVSDELVSESEHRIVAPILEALARKGMDYRGVLFSGILVQDGRPYCLEYNVRFGDPETQSVLPRLGPEFVDALWACAKGAPIPAISILDGAAVTVIVAAEGYPDNPKKGAVINLPKHSGALVFHAGTAQRGDELIVSGGRVFGITGMGATVEQARRESYGTAQDVQFDGAWFRTDIAKA